MDVMWGVVDSDSYPVSENVYKGAASQAVSEEMFGGCEEGVLIENQDDQLVA